MSYLGIHNFFQEYINNSIIGGSDGVENIEKVNVNNPNENINVEEREEDINFFNTDSNSKFNVYFTNFSEKISNNKILYIIIIILIIICLAIKIFLLKLLLLIILGLLINIFFGISIGILLFYISFINQNDKIKINFLDCLIILGCIIHIIISIEYIKNTSYNYIIEIILFLLLIYNIYKYKKYNKISDNINNYDIGFKLNSEVDGVDGFNSKNTNSILSSTYI